MPEYPEVFNVCRDLNHAVSGCVIERVSVLQDRMRVRVPSTLSQFSAHKTISNVHNVAKYVFCELCSGGAIVMHLGMSGVVSVRPSDADIIKHDHVIFYLSNGMSIAYNDPRRFGMVSYIEDLSTLKGVGFDCSMGLDPLSDLVTGHFIHQKAVKRRVAIKSFLMDSSVISGIGNIYASEILFAAKINPVRLASSLTLQECDLLAVYIKRILLKAIDMGGCSMRDYVRPDGSSGGFQSALMVYGRTGSDCYVCSGSVCKIVQNGRSSFYCPNCQQECVA